MTDSEPTTKPVPEKSTQYKFSQDLVTDAINDMFVCSDDNLHVAPSQYGGARNMLSAKRAGRSSKAHDVEQTEDSTAEDQEEEESETSTSADQQGLETGFQPPNAHYSLRAQHYHRLYYTVSYVKTIFHWRSLMDPGTKDVFRSTA